MSRTALFRFSLIAAALTMFGFGCAKNADEVVPAPAPIGIDGSATQQGDSSGADAPVEKLPVYAPLSPEQRAAFVSGKKAADGQAKSISYEDASVVSYDYFFRLAASNGAPVRALVERGISNKATYVRGAVWLPKTEVGPLEVWLTESATGKRLLLTTLAFNEDTMRWEFSYMTTTSLSSFDAAVIVRRNSDGSETNILEGFGGDESAL